MSAPRLDMTVTFGSVLSICTVLITAGIAYGVYTQQTENMRERITNNSVTLQTEISNRRAVDTSLEGRLRVIENGQARADERFNNILQLLSQIDGRLERIEEGRSRWPQQN